MCPVLIEGMQIVFEGTWWQKQVTGVEEIFMFLLSVQEEEAKFYRMSENSSCYQRGKMNYQTKQHRQRHAAVKER